MFGDIISKLRQEHQLTQEELASKIGINRASLSHYEKNRREPDYNILKQFAAFFGVTTDYLLGYTNDAAPSKIDDSFIETVIKPFVISLAKENPLHDANFLEYVQNASTADYWALFNAAADLHFENGKPIIKLKKINSELSEILEKLKKLQPQERKALLRILIDDL
jgi:transcriptional regulator with XRE-family HTH domain